MSSKESPVQKMHREMVIYAHRAAELRSDKHTYIKGLHLIFNQAAMDRRKKIDLAGYFSPAASILGLLRSKEEKLAQHVLNLLAEQEALRSFCKSDPPDISSLQKNLLMRFLNPPGGDEQKQIARRALLRVNAALQKIGLEALERLDREPVYREKVAGCGYDAVLSERDYARILSGQRELRNADIDYPEVCSPSTW